LPQSPFTPSSYEEERSMVLIRGGVRATGSLLAVHFDRVAFALAVGISVISARSVATVIALL
jgi:hypothetical protein